MLRACAILLSTCAGAALAVAACSGSTSTSTVTTVTGVLIRSESLIAGHGCGPQDTQVYKYVAVLEYSGAGPGQTPPDGKYFAGSFDCFTDGVFANLTPSSTGISSFDVQIYAFNAATYTPNAPKVEGAVSDANDKGADPRPLLDSLATWETTNCSATPQANVQVLAVCETPLAPNVHASDGGADSATDAASDAGDGGDAGPTIVRVATSSFANADGGTFQCGADYQQVSGVYVDNRDAGAGSNGMIAAVSCPADLVLPHAQPGVSYQIDALLLTAAGSTGIAKARCTATASLGQTVTATCAPATPP